MSDYYTFSPHSVYPGGCDLYAVSIEYAVVHVQYATLYNHRHAYNNLLSQAITPPRKEQQI